MQVIKWVFLLASLLVAASSASDASLFSDEDSENNDFAYLT